MADFLDLLAKDAKKTITEGYYTTSLSRKSFAMSLKKAINNCKTAPIITEIKSASPSFGTIKKNLVVGELARAMANGGAVGLSVLTEPKHFNGSLSFLVEARKAVKLPILMKDIILSPLQIKTASRIGANVVLLIQALFDRGYCNYNVKEMIALSHSKKLEVLLETRNKNEFASAVETDADLIGINNRNLGTLRVDLDITKTILENNSKKETTIVSESGIEAPGDIRFLHKYGANAFLVGSSIMRSTNVEEKVKELVQAL